MTYCISKGGTFGLLKRRYTSDITDKEIVLIEWGPLKWLSPVNLEDVHLCYSCCESRARDEAMKWLEEQDKITGQEREAVMKFFKEMSND